ncbi:MAG TPA: hypothetical protein VK689_21590, partial [Armatimonadota bacterium]|nr:hypothetical protein [Armatimonadota bacterium]
MELIATQQAESLKGPIDLAELARRARADAKRCQDFPTVPFRHTRVRVDGSWMFQGEVGKLSRHAFSQLC